MTVEDGHVFIRGEGVALRALRESDLDGPWYSWFNDPDVTWFQNKGLQVNTVASQRKFFEHLQHDRSQVTLAIEHEGRHVGNVTLKDIDWIHRTAELGIVIGDRGAWGKGLGAQCWWLITRYGFLTLNLNKIIARIFKDNERSMRTALRSGYVVEGTQAQQFYRHGVYHDLVLVGTTAAQWRAQFGTDERRGFSDSPLPTATDR